MYTPLTTEIQEFQELLGSHYQPSKLIKCYKITSKHKPNIACMLIYVVLPTSSMAVSSSAFEYLNGIR